MAKGRNREFLQPSLLDRLTDDEPEKKSEPKERRGLTHAKLRKSVLRDLNWLFNSSNLASVQDLDDSPEVGKSVLNYGLPGFSGHTISGVDIPEIERLLNTPAGLSRWDLYLNPDWDFFRDDERFNALARPENMEEISQ